MSSPSCAGRASDPASGAGGASASVDSAAGTEVVVDQAGTGSGGVDAIAGTSVQPTDGWLDGASNVLSIQGALFSHADSVSALGLVSDFTGTKACMKGTAAKVDLSSTACATKMYDPPATDCYGMYWGAALVLNLNQATPSSSPMPYDASALKGFSFEISSESELDTRDLTFLVEGAKGQFCTPWAKKIVLGTNIVLFKEQLAQCFRISTDPPNPTAETGKSALLNIAWRVVTSSAFPSPFDFCISNLRALQ